MNIMKRPLATAWIVVALGLSVAAHAQNTALRVGAAKVDVTPAQNALPQNYQGILDHIYSRAIVIDNGSATAALITVDAGGVSDAIWQGVAKQLESELGIPAKNVLLTATHSHSVPGQPAGPYTQKIVESVRLAKQRLAPARIGYGTGVSYINVNRNIIDPKTKRWWEGPNYEGPSDKTVAVIKFESLNGEPLAVYYNYAMHGVAAGQLDLVSGDAPGTTSKYIEDSFDDKIVALWSSGAAGDQNPIYFQQTYDLREIRIKDYAKRGQDISNSMPPGGQGLDRKDPTVIKLMNQQKQMILSMGQFLGEEVMHVMRGMERMEPSVRIDGRYKIVSCPGRERTNAGRAGFPGEYKESGPVDIRLGLLQVVELQAIDPDGGVRFATISCVRPLILNQRKKISFWLLLPRHRTGGIRHFRHFRQQNCRMSTRENNSFIILKNEPATIRQPDS